MMKRILLPGHPFFICLTQKSPVRECKSSARGCPYHRLVHGFIQSGGILLLSQGSDHGTPFHRYLDHGHAFCHCHHPIHTDLQGETQWMANYGDFNDPNVRPAAAAMTFSDLL